MNVRGGCQEDQYTEIVGSRSKEKLIDDKLAAARTSCVILDDSRS